MRSSLPGAAVAWVVGLAAILGLGAGSFLSAVIHRLPRGVTVAAPRSRCPACRRPLPWSDLVPVLSWFALRGRCRFCAARIAPRYPLVELLTALAFAAATAELAWSPARLVEALGLTALLVAVSAIDLEHQLIPNRLVLWGLVWSGGWRLAGLVLPVAGVPTALEGVAGAGLLFALMGLLAVVSRGGMGGGDVKFSAVMGAALGWKLGLLALSLAFVLGGAVGLSLLALGRKRRRDPIAFGPFLAAGTWVALLWGEELLAIYLRGAG